MVRTIEKVSLGFHYEGATLPHVACDDPGTLKDGVMGRMGKLMPTPYAGYYDELKLVTQAFCNSFLEPLRSDTDVSFENWLEHTNYNERRKEELRKCYEEVINPLEKLGTKKQKYFLVKLFAKDESYVEFKHARGIYARDDVAKCFFGPYFKCIENVVYEYEAFIKHVPVADRANYIYDLLYRIGGKYVQTDYSSFECHFDRRRMQSCEFVMYKHMMQYLPTGNFVLRVMTKILCGINIVQNKMFFFSVAARRMSGEMCTSLGNGFSNLMMYYHQCWKLGLLKIQFPFFIDDPRRIVPGVVEGDDGLFSHPLSGKVPSTESFTSCGCLIKLVVFTEISAASFCGLLFDEDAREVVADIRKIMCEFGWTSKQYSSAKVNKLKGLLRCKAMSFICQYPSCPVVAAMCRAALRLTRGYDVRHLVYAKHNDEYTRERIRYGLSNYKDFMNRSIHPRTRLLVQELFGLTVAEQLDLENMFDSMIELRPWTYGPLLDILPESWFVYYENYSITTNNYHNIHEIPWDVKVVSGAV